MTTSVALTLLGFGIGVLVVANGRKTLRAAMPLRERAIMAQQIAAEAARVARDLAERAAKET